MMGIRSVKKNLRKNNTPEGGKLSRPLSLPKKVEALILKRVTNSGKMPC